MANGKFMSFPDVPVGSTSRRPLPARSGRPRVSVSRWSAPRTVELRIQPGEENGMFAFWSDWMIAIRSEYADCPPGGAEIEKPFAGIDAPPPSEVVPVIL